MLKLVIICHVIEDNLKSISQGLGLKGSLKNVVFLFVHALGNHFSYIVFFRFFFFQKGEGMKSARRNGKDPSCPANT